MAGSPIKAESIGSLDDQVTECKADAARRITIGVTAGTAGLQAALRRQLAVGFSGDRMPNIIGSKVYPGGGRVSMGAAGSIFPRGPRANMLIDSFSQGAVITSRDGLWLAIPTENVPIGRGGRRATIAQVEESYGRLRFVFRNPPPSLLVLDNVIAAKSRKGWRPATARRVAQGRDVMSVVMFLLVKQARMPKKLDFDASAREWADRVPDLIEQLG